ncbi:MAG: pyridoxamine 5-phosphate oxidase family protein [Frankiales bacterium]|nr:pyridoxamine 5-phosphate oxidase family protein [Frankiales bacterium]
MSQRASDARGENRDSPTVEFEQRTVPARMREKYPAPRWADVQALIADTLVAHVAFVAEGAPRVLPVAIATSGTDVLLHGSSGSGWLRALAAGLQVSISVAAVDGLVIARSAFESSIHYRSAVLFGRCRELRGCAAAAALDVLTDALIPGRVAEVRRPTAKELAATLVLRVTVSDWTYKLSDGWPTDPDSDVAGDAWAGVLPTARGYLAPRSAPDLRSNVAVPESALNLLKNSLEGPPVAQS